MKLIVGLGNPGPKYTLTRHNVGFMLLDVIAQEFAPGSKWKSEFKAETMKLTWAGQQVLLVKPQTFMNLSGESVQPIVGMYKIALTDVLVAHDEIDLPFGEVRFQSKRGAGGHNGIKSLHQMLGSDEYCRLRLGVGRPPVFVNDAGEMTRPTMEVHEYVLQNFTKDEQKQLAEDLFSHFVDATEAWIMDGLQMASSKFNRPRAQAGQEK